MALRKMTRVFREEHYDAIANFENGYLLGSFAKAHCFVSIGYMINDETLGNDRDWKDPCFWLVCG